MDLLIELWNSCISYIESLRVHALLTHIMGIIINKADCCNHCFIVLKQISLRGEEVKFEIAVLSVAAKIP